MFGGAELERVWKWAEFQGRRTCDDKDEEDTEAAENTAQNDSSRWTHASQLVHLLINTRVTKIGEPPWALLFLFARWVHGAYRSARPARTRTIRRNEYVQQRQLFSRRKEILYDSNADLCCRRAELPQKHLCQVCPSRCALVDVPW